MVNKVEEGPVAEIFEDPPASHIQKLSWLPCQKLGENDRQAIPRTDEVDGGVPHQKNFSQFSGTAEPLLEVKGLTNPVFR